jgi:YVTN family beta-propeller protein
VPVGSDPNGIAIAPDGTKVYVTNSDYGNSNNGTVSVINTNRVIASIKVGNYPGAFGQFNGSIPAQTDHPVANFNSNITSGYAPLDIQFYDSSRNVKGWNWTF